MSQGIPSESMWLGSAGAAPAVVKGGGGPARRAGVGSAERRSLPPRAPTTATPAASACARSTGTSLPTASPAAGAGSSPIPPAPNGRSAAFRRTPRRPPVTWMYAQDGHTQDLGFDRCPACGRPSRGLDYHLRPGARTRLPLTRLSAPVAHRRCPELRDCRVWLRSLPVTASIDELQQRLAIQGSRMFMRNVIALV